MRCKSVVANHPNAGAQKLNSYERPSHEANSSTCVTTGKEITSWRAHTTIAKGLCFSPDGKQLATTSHAHDPKLWDVKTGSLIVALERQPLAASNGGGHFKITLDSHRVSVGYR